MRRKRNVNPSLGDEYDTVLDLSKNIGRVYGKQKTRCTVVDLRSGKRKIVDTGLVSILNQHGILKWEVAVPGCTDEDVLFMVVTALRSILRYVVRKGRGRPKYASRLKSVVPRNCYDEIREALTATGKVICKDKKGRGFTVELFVPKWTGWTIEQVYGLSGEAVEIEYVPTNKKAVLQIDKNTGEVIRCFESVRAARRAMGQTRGKIAACCKGRVKSAHGFRWRYAD